MKRKQLDRLETISGILSITFFLLLVVSIFAGIIIGVRNTDNKQKEFEINNTIEEYPDYYKINDIASLSRDSESNGLGAFLFHIGIGMIKGESYYYYYVVNNGVYSLEKIKTKECQIIMTGDIEPCIAKRKNITYDRDYLLILPVGAIQEEFTG